MDGKLIASTGFQRGLYNFEEINSLLREGLGQDVKEVVYINRRLRSALDVFKRGGHVTNEFKDQFFRLNYDNRREILFDVSANNEFNASEKLLDSKPVEDISVAELYRGLSKKSFVQKYQRTLNKKIYKSSYKNVLEITVRNFVRCLLSGKMGLNKNVFENYLAICEFVNGYDPNLKMTPNIVAQLKRRSAKPRILIRDSISDNFIDYVKIKFPDFDSKTFFNEFFK